MSKEERTEKRKGGARNGCTDLPNKAMKTPRALSGAKNRPKSTRPTKVQRKIDFVNGIQ